MKLILLFTILPLWVLPKLIGATKPKPAENVDFRHIPGYTGEDNDG